MKENYYSMCLYFEPESGDDRSIISTHEIDVKHFMTVCEEIGCCASDSNLLDDYKVYIYLHYDNEVIGSSRMKLKDFISNYHILPF